LLRWLPENVSTHGSAIDSLFLLIYNITGITFLLVAGVMVAFLILYRRREGVRAGYTHGSKALEVVWTVVPAIILVVLTVMSARVWRDLKMTQPAAEVEARVIGKQFNWRMIYPGPDGRFDTADDLELANELHVPVDRTVVVQLQSEDVIHSFFLPHMRVKQDAVPGRTTHVWFTATKAGRYEIACAELCGFGHYNMRGFLTVHTPEDYAAWVASAWPAGEAPAAGEEGVGEPRAQARGAE
jgi:cytochrome c oxidase subunit 2